MEAFEPGWLPRGWKRGLPLTVHNANYRYGGNISITQQLMLEPGGGDASSLDYDLRFHYSERLRVVEWLFWYFDLDKDAYEIAEQIKS